MDAAFPDRLIHSTVIFDERLWVIGGENSTRYFSDVWYSDDGITWTQATANAAFGRRCGHKSVVFDDRMWVIGGRDDATRKPLSDVWYSSDGVTWTRATEDATFAPRWDFGIVVFDEKMWVLGGTQDGILHNDVWYSSDGVTWKRAVTHAGFTPRMEPSAAVFDNRIWVTGGFDWRTHFNDIWMSPDGKQWTQVSSPASFPPRRYQSMETADGKLWVIGGYDGKNALNDLWYTTDGVTWQPAKTEKPFPARWGFTTAVFRNKIWIIAGTSGNDVWYADLYENAGSAKPATGIPASENDAVVVNKTISPSSIKQGMDAKVTITVLNKGTMPVHDVEIVDATSKDFPVADGVTRFSFTTLDPHDTRILTYTVHAASAGSFRLNRTTVMYADHEGNYHIVQSNSPGVNVLAPLFSPTPQEESGSFLRDLAAWFEGLNLFADKRSTQT